MKSFALIGKIISAIITGGFLLLVGGCTIAILHSGPKHVAKGPLSFGRIPAEATNIDYVEPAPFAAADFASFDIPETGFRAWVDDWRTQDPALPPLTTREEIFVRFYNLTTDKLDHRRIPTALNTWRTIEDRELNLTFDLEKKRAYFKQSWR